MSLGQYIADNIIIDEIKRSDMPQIKGKSIPEMLEIFDEYGIPYEEIEVKVDMLKPVQEDVKPEKIESIVNDIKSGKKMPPIIISKDLYIIDGHHRWLAYKELDEISIEAIELGYNKEPSLELINKVEDNVDEHIITEAVKNIVAIYSGRFQPFHLGHHYSYEALVKKFGKNNVYIATSDVTGEKSPFNFKEKQKIITTMFGIPKSKVVKVKNPYNPEEILNKFDKTNTAYVVGLGEKDTNRLNGKYYKPYTGKDLNSFEKNGYIYNVPQLQLKINGKTISGTVVRDSFSKELFNKIYPKFNKDIYNLLSKKLVSEDLIIKFLQNKNIQSIVESSKGSGATFDDDGPPAFFGTHHIYKKFSRKRARQVGWSIINYLLGNNEDFYHHPSYPDDGPVTSVSFFPAGVLGKLTPLNQDDLVGIKGFNKWAMHVHRFVELLGWEFIDYAGAERSIKLTEGKLLKEGGAYGHLSNVWEDWDLTFDDLYTLVDISLEGKLELAQEKTDGQNLMFSWIDGKLKAARNAGHTKNFGRNALDIRGIENMFSNRGAIQTAFVEALKDLDKAIRGLSNKQKDKIFKNGKKFMSVEVIYPQTTNVIPYNYSMLVFHGTFEYDKNGKVIKSDKEDARILAGMITQINADIQNTFKIRGPNNLKLPKSQDFSTQKSLFNSRIKNLQTKFKLKSSDSVANYHQAWWKDFIEKQAKSNKYNIPNNVLMDLVKRWAFSDKSVKIIDLRKKIDNDKFRDWMNEFDKNDHSEQLKKNIEPFETIFLQVGSKVLQNMNVFLAINPDDSLKKLKSDINSTILQLKKTGDPSTIEKLNKQLTRLQKSGGFDAIMPTEGITFMFNGKLYKYTGTFAPINQLLGILKFGGR